jgi:uncharacterized protein (TIGR03437 family)
VNLGTPAGVAADSAGDLYITDEFRVLKVSQGKIATIAAFESPHGIAVDNAGNVYVADPARHRVWMLTPSGNACSASTTPGSVPVASSGGTVNLTVQTGSTCSWAVESLPDWIAVSGSPFGSGPDTVTLAVASNMHAPRAATILVGGQNVAVSQAGILAITGQVTFRGAPLSGVNLMLSGGQAASDTTDSGGHYSFSNLNSAATYTVTPALPGYAFVPTSQTFTNAASNPAANFVAWPLPQITGLGPVFGSFLQPMPTTFAPGEIVSIFGTNLCADPPAAAKPTLPDRLGTCIVQVGSVNLRLYYTSATQINAVLPQTLATGARQLTVSRYTDTAYKTLAAKSFSFPFSVSRISMAFVERNEDGSKLLVAQYPDGTLAGPARPVRAGDIVTLYLTGLGRKAQTFGEGAAPGRASAAAETIQVQVQGVAARVLYAGTQPSFPGFDQLTLQLPQYALPAGAGAVTVQITAPATGQVLRYELPAR